MTATEAATQFLPTNGSIFDSPLMTGLVILGAAALLFGFVAAIFLNMKIALLGMFGAFVVGMLCIIPTTNEYKKVQEQNQQKIAENVTEAYDIDHIAFYGPDPIKVIKGTAPVLAVVTVGAEDFNVIITQDADTFEPTLNSFEGETNMEKYKKKLYK